MPDDYDNDGGASPSKRKRSDRGGYYRHSNGWVLLLILAAIFVVNAFFAYMFGWLFNPSRDVFLAGLVVVLFLEVPFLILLYRLFAHRY